MRTLNEPCPNIQFQGNLNRSDMLDPNDPDDGTVEWCDRELKRSKEMEPELRANAIVGLIVISALLLLAWIVDLLFTLK